MKGPRLRAVAMVALVLLLTACPIVIEREPEVVPPEGDPADGPDDLPEAEPMPPGPAGDRAQPGSIGWALLSPEIPEVILEIASAGDASLPETAVAALEDTLVEHGAKTVIPMDGPTLPAQDTYRRDDLLEFALDERTAGSEEARVAMFVMALPGEFEVEGITGVALTATAFAVFTDAVADRLPPGAAVEPFIEATAIHELGHLFGLVNLTGEGAFHEDPDHPGHSENAASVMHWAVETATAMEVFTDGPPTEFSDDDLQEMARIREQRP